jgi:hypothetical protein
MMNPQMMPPQATTQPPQGNSIPPELLQAMAGQAQAPQDPVQAITQLLLKTVSRNDLNADIQAKNILTLAQAISQLTQQQPAQIPAEQQFQLEVQKLQLEHELKLQELQLKQEMHEQEMALKEEAHQNDQRRQDESHQQNLQLNNFQAGQQANQQQHQQALAEQKLSNDHAIKQKQAAQRPAPKGE